MNYIFLLVLFFVTLIYQIARLIMSQDKSRKKYRVTIIVIFSLATGYFLLDMPPLFSDGIKKETEIKVAFGFGKRGYINAVLQDQDGSFYWVGNFEKPGQEPVVFQPQGDTFSNIRLTYLPFTKSVVKVEHRLDIETALLIMRSDKRYEKFNSDGYYEIYDYSYDYFFAFVMLLMTTIAIIYNIKKKN